MGESKVITVTDLGFASKSDCSVTPNTIFNVIQKQIEDGFSSQDKYCLEFSWDDKTLVLWSEHDVNGILTYTVAADRFGKDRDSLKLCFAPRVFEITEYVHDECGRAVDVQYNCDMTYLIDDMCQKLVEKSTLGLHTQSVALLKMLVQMVEIFDLHQYEVYRQAGFLYHPIVPHDEVKATD